MKAIALLNAAAGTLVATSGPADEIANAFAAHGIEVELQPVSGKTLKAEAERAAGSDADIVIAAGGDGTLSTVAGVLAGGHKPLGILPMGTLNHFAKDLGIPLDLAEAVRVIAEHHVATIDVAEVNGRVFVNNSSLGLYPELVLGREAERRRHGWSKWTAMLVAMVKVGRRFPLIAVRITAGEETFVRKTALAFVGNNPYQFDLLKVGTRTSLCDGELSLYVSRAGTRWEMLKLIVRTVLGNLDVARDIESFALEHCRIESKRHRLHVAVDGEVIVLAPPLDYRIRCRALRVCVPRGSALLASTDP